MQQVKLGCTVLMGLLPRGSGVPNSEGIPKTCLLESPFMSQGAKMTSGPHPVLLSCVPPTALGHVVQPPLQHPSLTEGPRFSSSNPPGSLEPSPPPSTTGASGLVMVSLTGRLSKQCLPSASEATDYGQQAAALARVPQYIWPRESRSWHTA